MNRTILLSLFGAIALVSESEAQSDLPFAQVALPTEASVRYERVLLGDIANITTTDGALRQALYRLDVGELAEGQTALKLSRSMIAIRIRLAGISGSSFSIDGPKDVLVSLETPTALTDADVEKAATEAFLEVLGGSRDDIRVRLSGPFLASIPKGIRDRTGLRVEVVTPGEGRLGRLSTQVRLWDGDSIAISRPTGFNVLQRQKVAVVLASVRRDQPVTNRNVRLESRFVTRFQDQPTEGDLKDKVARRDLEPGRTLSLNDLKPATRQATGLAVRARDAIEVESVAGVLRVYLKSATAIQSGRVGDLIQFRNTDSGNIRSGRITGPGRVLAQ